jgi:hypothetical protein
MKYLNRVVENLKKFGKEEGAQASVPWILGIGAAIAMAVIAWDVKNYVEELNGTADHGVPEHHYTSKVPKTLEEFIERSG